MAKLLVLAAYFLIIGKPKNRLLGLVCQVCIIRISRPTVLQCATSEFIVELNPRTVNVREGTNVTLECSYNLPVALIPMWEIDGMGYRVTNLPLGYESDGTNITFRALNSTVIRCFFNAFDVSTDEFVLVYSNNATVTTTPSPGKYTYLQTLSSKL